MTKEELGVRSEAITIAIKALEAEYVLARSQEFSFFQRKDIRKKLRALKSELEEINNQIKNL